MKKDRTDELINSILKIAQGDFDIELSLSDKNDKIDALAMGINMLIDDLKIKDFLSKENEKIKALNTELKIAKKKAEESDLLKTMFLQNISHEIRTPLNAIMGFAELLPTVIKDKKSLLKFSQIITNSSSNLLQIINDLLDISKIESGQMSLHEGEFLFDDVLIEIKKFFAEYKNKIHKSHIILKFITDCDILGKKFVFDQVKLKQILINLISNAIKYTLKGSVEVACSYNNDTEQLFVYIKDSGPGIPQEEQKSIFNRFVQSKKQNSDPGNGTGLGLSIVEGLIKLMKGKIWLESEINKGSNFHFSIPLKQKIK